MGAVLLREEPFEGPRSTLFRRRVEPEDGAAWARLAILPGYCDHSGRYLECMRWWAARGVACQALDFRGHGLAGGRRAFVQRWEEYLDDLGAFLRGCGGPPEAAGPLFVLGHSHGGLVLAAAGVRGIEGVRGCVLASPYLRTRMPVPAVKRWAARALDPLLPALRIPIGLKSEWMSREDAMVTESRRDPLLMRHATPRWYIGALAAQEETMRRAGEFRQPLLVLTGDADPVADPSAAHAFFRLAGSEDRTFRVYPGHRHELLRESERERVFEHVLEWLRQRAGASGAETRVSPAGGPAGDT